MQIDATHAALVPAGGQVVAYTGTAGVSTAINAHSGTVRLVSTTACFVDFSAAGGTVTAAVNTGAYLPADSPEYFAVPNNCKISAVQLTAGGNLYISQA